jgi:hypothetical protein
VLQICTQKLAKDTRLLTNDLSLHQRDPEYPLLHHGITAGANRRTTLALLERFRYVTNYTITVFYFSYKFSSSTNNHSFRINFLLLEVRVQAV